MERLCILVLASIIAANTLAAQTVGHQTSVEVKLGRGTDPRLCNANGDISLVESFCLNRVLHVGAGLGLGYADGKLQEIHQTTSSGTPLALCDNLITDISWSTKTFLRIKASIPNLSFSPFILCDIGYNYRIGSYSSARMNTGFYVGPGVGCDFKLMGKQFYGALSLEDIQWEYEYVKTPHSDLDTTEMIKTQAQAFKLILGYCF